MQTSAPTRFAAGLLVCACAALAGCQSPSAEGDDAPLKTVPYVDLPRFMGDRLDGVMRVPTIQIGPAVDIWIVTHPALRANAMVRSLIRALAAAIRKDARLFAGSSR